MSASADGVGAGESTPASKVELGNRSKEESIFSKPSLERIGAALDPSDGVEAGESIQKTRPSTEISDGHVSCAPAQYTDFVTDLGVPTPDFQLSGFPPLASGLGHLASFLSQSTLPGMAMGASPMPPELSAESSKWAHMPCVLAKHEMGRAHCTSRMQHLRIPGGTDGTGEADMPPLSEAD